MTMRLLHYAWDVARHLGGAFYSDGIVTIVNGPTFRLEDVARVEQRDSNVLVQVRGTELKLTAFGDLDPLVMTLLQRHVPVPHSSPIERSARVEQDAPIDADEAFRRELAEVEAEAEEEARARVAAVIEKSRRR